MKKINKLFLIIAFVFAGYSCDLTDLDQLNKIIDIIKSNY